MAGRMPWSLRHKRVLPPGFDTTPVAGESNIRNPNLPPPSRPEDEELIHRVAATNPQTVVAVMAGESQWTITPMPAVIQFVRQGRIKLLAHTLPERTPQFPDTPTVAETVPGYTYSGWTGLMLPKGTPQPVIDKLRNAVLKVAATREFKEMITNQGAVVQTSTPEEFAKLVASEIEATGKAVKASSLTIE